MGTTIDTSRSARRTSAACSAQRSANDLFEDGLAFLIRSSAFEYKFERATFDREGTELVGELWSVREHPRRVNDVRPNRAVE
jgi:hypothetical protein